jgi:hypothetical protein
MAYTDNEFGPAGLNSIDFFKTDFNTEGGPFDNMGGSAGSPFSFTTGGGQAPWAGEYRGRVGADTTNLPPSMRGSYENSAPSFEAIDSAYNANLKNGMSHQEIMTLFNNQADNDKKFWADGFAKDPNFSQTLYNKSQAMMGTDANQASIKAHQKNIAALAASRGAFTTPTLGPTAGAFKAAVKSATPKARTVWGTSPAAGRTIQPAKRTITPGIRPGATGWGGR